MQKIAILAATFLAFLSFRVEAQVAQGKDGAHAPGPESLGDTEAYLPSLLQAADPAIRFLSGLQDPVFASESGVALQMLPGKPTSVVVLFPTRSHFPDHLKLFEANATSLCQSVSATSTNAQRFVVCDPDALRKLEIFIRVSHNHQFIETTIKNDWALMQLLNRIASDPVGLLKEVKPPVSEAHIQEHMIFALMFLLSHESWHLTHQTAAGFEAAEGLASQGAGDLPQKMVCRNYEEFVRQGITLDIDKHSPIPLAEEGPTKDPTVSERFEETRPIWGEELEADAYGGTMMAHLVRYLKDHGSSQGDLESTASEIVQTFGQIMISGWYPRLYSFAQAHCSAYAGKDFFLTWCLCSDVNLYDQLTLKLFGLTHPPIMLRMFRAAVGFSIYAQREVGVDFGGKNPELQIARSWIYILKGMVDVPLKLTATECTVLPNLPDGMVHFTQIFPDLAGFQGPNASQRYPGYPADEWPLLSQCSSGDKSPAKLREDRPEKNPQAPPLSFASLALVDATGQFLPRFEEYSAETFQAFLRDIPGIALVDRSQVDEFVVRNRVATGSLPGDPAAASQFAASIGGSFLFTGTAKQYSVERGEESLAVELVVIDSVKKEYVFRKTYTAKRPEEGKKGHRELLDSILASARMDVAQLAADLQKNM